MLLLNRYTYDPATDFLADGGSARVYKAVDSQRDNLQVVIKFYYHTTTATFKSNMERIKTLQHPNLVALYDYTELDMVNAFGQTDTLRIGIWEYAPADQKDLSAASTADTEQAVRELLAAVQYLHQHNCAHLDLVQQNVLLSDQAPLKLNNYELMRSTPYTPDDQQNDLKAIGQVLYGLLGGVPNAANLPSHVREVYKAMIAQCQATNLEHGAKNTDDLSDLLNNYDRNQRFDAVIALNEEQFISRYHFDPDADKIGQTDYSLAYQAHDNLLDTEVELEIFMLDAQWNGAKALQAIDLKQYTHLFKVNLNSEADMYQDALVGIRQSHAQNIDTNPSTVGNMPMDMGIEPPDGTAESATEAQQRQEYLTVFSQQIEETVNDAIDQAKVTEDKHDNGNVSIIDDESNIAFSEQLESIVTDSIQQIGYQDRHDSTNVPMEMVDDKLALELAALDSQLDMQIIEKSHDEPTIDDETPIDKPSSDNSFRDQDHEPTTDDEATTTDEANNNSGDSSDDSHSDFADDGDMVSLDEAPTEADEEPLKGTEIIQNEAIEQVLRDMERLLKG
jgi:serine/threonine protein kinase